MSKTLSSEMGAGVRYIDAGVFSLLVSLKGVYVYTSVQQQQQQQQQ